MISWVAYLLQFIGLAAPCGLFYYSINRKFKKAEVKEKEIEIIRKQDDEWQELYREQKEQKEKLQEQISDLYKIKDKLMKQVGTLELKVQQLSWFRCQVNNCPNRIPPHVFDVNGTEMEQNTKENDLA